MAIDPEALLALELPEVEQTYTERDTILYALGCGLGLDPTDPGQLRYLYERSLEALPTMVTILAHPGFWMRDLDTGIDWLKVVQGEQGVRLHRPLPPRRTVVAQHRITGVIDKGEGRGAVLLWSRELYDKASGDHLATAEQVTFCRGDGGFGGPSAPQPRPHAIPERPPDESRILETSPQAALIYRLCGDLNPIHADPEAARAAGFDRPILHGLATFGRAAHALIVSDAAGGGGRLEGIRARFTAPVFPGETLRADIWREDGGLGFRLSVVGRGAVAIDNGFAAFAAARTGTGGRLYSSHSNE